MFQGHGSRLGLRVGSYRADILTSKDLVKLTALSSALFEFSVQSFNPKSITHRQQYGWAEPSGKAKKLNADYDVGGGGSGGGRQFNNQGNKHVVEIEGTIYPRAFNMLDMAVLRLSLFRQSMSDTIDDFDLVCRYGAIFNVLSGSGFKAVSLGEGICLEFNYSKEDFIYDGEAMKIPFNMVLELMNEI